MKSTKLGILLASIMVAVARAEPPDQTSVGTNSVCILPDRTAVNYPALPSLPATLYSGRTYLISNLVYWVKTQGAVIAAPTNTPYGNVTAGGAVLRRITDPKRNGFVVVNRGTGTVYLAIGYPATATNGITLYGNGGSWATEAGSVPQQKVFAISVGSTNAVTVQEW